MTSPARPTLRVPGGVRPLLYVAGPMTTGADHYRNVGLGMSAGLFAFYLGWAPFIPHMDAFLQMALGFSGDLPISYEEWMELDFVYLRASQALLRQEGASGGADREVELALALGKPVYTVETLPQVVLSGLRSVP